MTSLTADTDKGIAINYFNDYTHLIAEKLAEDNLFVKIPTQAFSTISYSQNQQL
jgi:hypothetical protein